MTRSNTDQLYSNLIRELDTDYRIFAPPAIKSSRLVSYVPSGTLGISLTGHYCSQACAHCNGHYLKTMLPVDNLTEKHLKNINSVLVSGGTIDKSCCVPITKHIDTLAKIPNNIRLNIHPGFQPAHNLQGLQSLKPLISFDMPGSDYIIKNVYNQPYCLSDYKKLLKDYISLFETAVHLTIGLSEEKYEEKIVDYLSEEGVKKLVLLVFRPTKNTAMANHRPPSISKIMGTIKQVCKKDIESVLLGCMRPAGHHRKNLDILAWMHGIECIVMPNKKLQKALSDENIPIIVNKNCCAL